MSHILKKGNNMNETNEYFKNELLKLKEVAKQIKWKIKMEIIQTGEDAHEDDNYEWTFETPEEALAEVFDEWIGWGWIQEGFIDGGTKTQEFIDAELLTSFVIRSLDDEEIQYTVGDCEELTEVINTIFNSFKSGYEKKYEFTEV